MEYFRYEIRNVEPIRIADDSISQSGQAASLRYIPGTTIRGIVVNSAVRKLGDSFDEYKKILFSSKVQFLNALPAVDGRELIPSPKGFYEDKAIVSGKKAIENVVLDGDFTPGYKRANLGKFCYFDEDCINYYNVNTGSDLRIRINHGDKAMFRNEYIMPGYTFVGYIAVDDSSVKELISEAFGNDIIVGNARSQGMGRCEVVKADYVSAKNFPYEEYSVKEDVSGNCYMMLLSGMAMRNEFGEYAGIHLSQLEQMMGVSNLKIEYCSTATINVRGYNRTLGIKLPSVTMYEMGSVFKLSFDGVFAIDRANKMMESGFGVRVNEGFGRVIFLDHYEKISSKKECLVNKSVIHPADKMPLDNDVLKLVAANYARVVIRQEMQKHILDGVNKMGIANSQVSAVRALLEQNRYNPKEGVNIVSKYFEHASEKAEKQNVQKKQADIKPFMKTIMRVLENDLEETLAIEQMSFMGYKFKDLIGEEETFRMKFEYLVEMIKYENRKGA